MKIEKTNNEKQTNFWKWISKNEKRKTNQFLFAFVARHPWKWKSIRPIDKDGRVH